MNDRERGVRVSQWNKMRHLGEAINHHEDHSFVADPRETFFLRHAKHIFH
jgi:hypothetical protein